MLVYRPYSNAFLLKSQWEKPIFDQNFPIPREGIEMENAEISIN